MLLYGSDLRCTANSQSVDTRGGRAPRSLSGNSMPCPLCPDSINASLLACLLICQSVACWNALLSASTAYVYAAVGVVVHLSRGQIGSTAGIAAPATSPTPKAIP